MCVPPIQGSGCLLHLPPREDSTSPPFTPTAIWAHLRIAITTISYDAYITMGNLSIAVSYRMRLSQQSHKWSEDWFYGWGDWGSGEPLPMITYLAPSISLPSWAFDTPCWATVWGNLSGTCLPKFLLVVSKQKGVSLATSSYTHMCHSNRTLALTLENQSVVRLWWSYFRVPIRVLTFHYTDFLLCPLSLTVPQNTPDKLSDRCSPDAAQASYSYTGMTEKIHHYPLGADW